MTTGFQADISGATLGLVTRLLQGIDFRMGLSCAVMPSFADLFALRIENHTAHARIRVRRVQAFAGKVEGQRHAVVIERAEVHFCFFPVRIFKSEICRSSSVPGCSRSSLSISSRNACTSSKRRYTEAKRT